MTQITFSVAGIPKPRQSFRFGNGIRKDGTAYTCKYQPKSDAAALWFEAVRQAVVAHKPDQPLAGPLEFIATYYLPRPKSLPKKCVKPAKKPDLENLTKAMVDVMEGIIFQGDQQICKMTLEKKYAETTPGVSIGIRTMEEQS